MKKKMQRGMTILEILLGMMVSMMIFLMATNFIVSVFRFDTKEKGQEAMEQVKDELQAELATKVRWAAEIEVMNDRLVVDGVEYRVDGGRFMRGGEVLTPRAVSVESFEINDYSTVDGLGSVEIVLGLRHSDLTTVRDTMRLVLSQRRVVFEREG